MRHADRRSRLDGYSPDLAPRSAYSLDVADLAPVFGSSTDCSFTGIISDAAASELDLVGKANYRRVDWHVAAAGDIPQLLAGIPARNHVFCITTDAPFRSPPRDILAQLKLGVLPMFSTGFSPAKLRAALHELTNLDYAAQYAVAEIVIERLLNADAIVFDFGRFGAQATLSMQGPLGNIHLFNQSGFIQWGHQSILPNGEISLLTDRHGEYSAESRFPLDGVLVLQGYPILHRGSCPCSIARGAEPCVRSFAERLERCESTSLPLVPNDERLERIFERLRSMHIAPSLATVSGGQVIDLRPLSPASEQFVVQFEELIALDSQYAKIHEIGFGLNRRASFYSGNYLPNELRYGVHFGFGLTPFTEFHLDLSCVPISVRSSTYGRQELVLDAAADQHAWAESEASMGIVATTRSEDMNQVNVHSSPVASDVTLVEQYNVAPDALYTGPEFEEYCISEGRYLPANRDRSPCMRCPLNTLCQPGFEEQVRRVLAGMNPSLTEACSFSAEALTSDALLRDLTPEQQAFVLSKIPGLANSQEVKWPAT